MGFKKIPPNTADRRDLSCLKKLRFYALAQWQRQEFPLSYSIIRDFFKNPVLKPSASWRMRLLKFYSSVPLKILFGGNKLLINASLRPP